VYLETLLHIQGPKLLIITQTSVQSNSNTTCNWLASNHALRLNMHTTRLYSTGKKQ